jgi:crotonobetainyl-CoA:carnitine CoA-transferase CaiB-like acyl-CoA transferase
MNDAPLAGLRIIDMTRLLPGPAMTMHLADFGAEIIKVEDTGQGDAMRSFPPMVRTATGEQLNTAFEATNRGKRSIAIDLKHADGREVLLKLAAGADALIEGFRPGVLDRLGLGWTVLNALNAKLVLCSLTGYGQSGPLAQQAGHDLNYCAMTGVLDQNRAAGTPAIPNLQIGDLLGGTQDALAALLIALLAAGRSGQGRHVDVAMTDGLLAHHFMPHSMLDAGKTPRAGETLLTGGVPCYGVYETKDGKHLALGALELKFWQNFCDAAGLSDLRDQHWTRGQAPGGAAAQAATARVAARLMEKDRADWETIFANADACMTPVLTPEEALGHAHHKARDLIRRRGKATLVGPFAQMPGAALAERPAPRAGEHTREILRELGYDAGRIDALLAAGTVREAQA